MNECVKSVTSCRGNFTIGGGSEGFKSIPDVKSVYPFATFDVHWTMEVRESVFDGPRSRLVNQRRVRQHTFDIFRHVSVMHLEMSFLAHLDMSVLRNVNVLKFTDCHLPFDLSPLAGDRDEIWIERCIVSGPREGGRVELGVLRDCRRIELDYPFGYLLPSLDGLKGCKKLSLVANYTSHTVDLSMLGGHDSLLLDLRGSDVALSGFRDVAPIKNLAIRLHEEGALDCSALPRVYGTLQVQAPSVKALDSVIRGGVCPAHILVGSKAVTITKPYGLSSAPRVHFYPHRPLFDLFHTPKVEEFEFLRGVRTVEVLFGGASSPPVIPHLEESSHVTLSKFFGKSCHECARALRAKGVCVVLKDEGGGRWKYI